MKPNVSNMRAVSFTILWVFRFSGVLGKKPKSSNAIRLYGSEDSAEGQFPFVTFHIQRSFRGYHTCSGSLISHEWALTAAHCINRDLNPGNHLVVAGKADLKEYIRVRYRNMPFHRNIDESKYDLQERRAAALYRHPRYSLAGSHDVGLVRLSRPFRTNERVTIISISSEPFERRSDCILLGYGLIEGNVRKYHLQYVKGMSANPARSCRFQKFRDVICLEDTSRGICQGDSGGPLICGNSVRGVASHGITDRNCGRGNIEQYYTDTELNLAWINSTRNSSR